MIVLGPMFGFGDLIQCLVLFCGIYQHGFCNVFIYMIFTLILAIQIVMPAGLALQTGKPLAEAY